MSSSGITPAFVATPWLLGGHAQTLAAALIPVPLIPVTLHPLELADGDRVETWRSGPVTGQIVILVLPGLEGSIASASVRHALVAIVAAGWCAVVVQARGAAGRPNRLARGGHAGWWQDAAAVEADLRHAGAIAIGAVGISLGGNQLLRWLGECGPACPLAAAAVVGAPFDLAISAAAMAAPGGRIYGRNLLHCMQDSAWAKGHVLAISREKLYGLKNVRAFDASLTAPIHGFADVDDYYRRASSQAVVGGIAVPTLVLHAEDDPLVPTTSLPQAASWSASVQLEVHRRGGHVGFLTGWWPQTWWSLRMVSWLAGCISGISGIAKLGSAKLRSAEQSVPGQ